MTYSFIKVAEQDFSQAAAAFVFDKFIFFNPLNEMVRRMLKQSSFARKEGCYIMSNPFAPSHESGIKRGKHLNSFLYHSDPTSQLAVSLLLISLSFVLA